MLELLILYSVSLNCFLIFFNSLFLYAALRIFLSFTFWRENYLHAYQFSIVFEKILKLHFVQCFW